MRVRQVGEGRSYASAGAALVEVELGFGFRVGRVEDGRVARPVHEALGGRVPMCVRRDEPGSWTLGPNREKRGRHATGCMRHRGAPIAIGDRSASSMSRPQIGVGLYAHRFGRGGCRWGKAPRLTPAGRSSVSLTSHDHLRARFDD